MEKPAAATQSVKLHFSLLYFSLTGLISSGAGTSIDVQIVFEGVFPSVIGELKVWE